MPFTPSEPTKGDELRFKTPGTHGQGLYKITIYINGALFINKNETGDTELAMEMVDLSNYRSFAVSGWIERIS